jgi:hypothetical protein
MCTYLISTSFPSAVITALCNNEQTDDTLLFRNSLLAEYALLLAKPPLGLGLSEDEVRKVAEGSSTGRFSL